MFDPSPAKRNQIDPPAAALGPFFGIMEAVRRNIEHERDCFTLLFTDIDGTLIPQGRAQNGDTARVLEWIDRQDAVIIPVTSRFWQGYPPELNLPSVQDKLQRGDIPPIHHALVTNGGEQALRPDGPCHYAADPLYTAWIRTAREGFPAAAVYVGVEDAFADLQKIVALDETEVRLIHSIDPTAPPRGIYFQPHVHGPGIPLRDRVSIYFHADSLSKVEEVESHFRRLFPRWRITCCEHLEFNAELRARETALRPLMYCLDVKPFEKDSAVDYFAPLIERQLEEECRRQQRPKPRLEVWFCGDGANDLAGMLNPKVTHVCAVGGAAEDLLQRLSRMKLDKFVYIEHHPERLAAASIYEALSRQGSKPA